MNANEIAEKLLEKPDLRVVIAESGRHEDNAPLMDVLEVEIVESSSEDIDETEHFIFWIQPNPETVKIADLKLPVVAEMKKAITCLGLEVDRSIVKDLSKKFDAVLAYYSEVLAIASENVPKACGVEYSNQICYKTNQRCKYDCKGLCRDSY